MAFAPRRLDAVRQRLITEHGEASASPLPAQGDGVRIGRRCWASNIEELFRRGVRRWSSTVLALRVAGEPREHEAMKSTLVGGDEDGARPRHYTSEGRHATGLSNLGPGPEMAVSAHLADPGPPARVSASIDGETRGLPWRPEGRTGLVSHDLQAVSAQSLAPVK